MRSHALLQKQAWPMLAAVIVVTVIVWGLYAWRFSRATDEGPIAERSIVEQSGHPAGEGRTSLRGMAGEATPPSGPYLGADDQDSSSPDSRADDRVQISNDSEPIVLDGVVSMAPEVPAASIEIREPEKLTAPFRLGQVRPDLATQAAESLKRGKAGLAAGEMLDARRALTDSLDRGLSSDDEKFARKELARIADTYIFGRGQFPDDPRTTIHQIGAGDTLVVIASRHRITVDLLARINGIDNPNIVVLGAKLKVVQGPFHAVIDKSDYRMDIYMDDIYVRSYRVGLGSRGSTPTGTWRVKNKLKNPEWTDPVSGQAYLADDPNNPIGERWIGLEGLSGEAAGREGFGIHGTIDPGSIGNDRSMGCIRLVGDDVAWVYCLLNESQSRIVTRP